MTKKINPLVAFFCAVTDELRKRLNPAEYDKLFSERAGSGKEDVGVHSAPTPDDQAMGRGPP